VSELGITTAWSNDFLTSICPQFGRLVAFNRVVWREDDGKIGSARTLRPNDRMNE